MSLLSPQYLRDLVMKKDWLRGIDLSNHECYHPNTRRIWDNLEPKLIVSIGISSRVEIYNILTGSRFFDNNCEDFLIYNLFTGEITLRNQKQNMRRPLSMRQAVGRAVFVMGGINNGDIRSFVESMDTADPTAVASPLSDARSSRVCHIRRRRRRHLRWTAIAPMPTPLYDAAATVMGRKIFVAGGTRGVKWCTAFFSYSIDDNSWTKLPDLPSARSYTHSLVSSSGLIYCVGGGSNYEPDREAYTRHMLIFNPDANCWSEKLDTILNESQFFMHTLAIPYSALPPENHSEDSGALNPAEQSNIPDLRYGVQQGS
ncbi:hypothetical protein PRIPAC_74598 [Pristionchus pacificus]|uniref:Uncharacterized protein n=1 Tax=Pristionchus pacificus TaxID=54126 RepID=A0A2A6CG94_PRIPA|nr:hypothetical protein PRIPAC_74598 [Pristionchus pacificus]|eukprot:PDM77083.1 hypothetical protein PRIPAC_42478 [Pristionchus pacificus]